MITDGFKTHSGYKYFLVYLGELFFSGMIMSRIRERGYSVCKLSVPSGAVWKSSTWQTCTEENR